MTMVKMLISIDDDIAKRFKEAVFKKKGMKQGNISLAAQEAFDMWTRQK